MDAAVLGHRRLDGGHPKAFPGPRQPLFAVPEERDRERERERERGREREREIESACRVSIL